VVAFGHRLAGEGGLERVRVMQQDVAQFVDQRLDPGGFVHVGAHFHGLAGEGGATVRPVEVGRGVDQADGVAVRLDLCLDGVPQSVRGIAVEQSRAGWFGQLGTGGLFGGEDVLDPETAQRTAGLFGLTRVGRFAFPEWADRAVGCLRVAAGVGVRGEDLVPGLALVDGAAQRLPGVEPGDVGRGPRRGHLSFGERGVVLQVDQPGVGCRVGMQLRLQGEVVAPVGAGLDLGHRLFDPCLGQRDPVGGRLLGLFSG
jgi:hypothetical protein